MGETLLLDDGHNLTESELDRRYYIDGNGNRVDVLLKENCADLPNDGLNRVLFVLGGVVAFVVGALLTELLPLLGLLMAFVGILLIVRGIFKV